MRIYYVWCGSCLQKPTTPTIPIKLDISWRTKSNLCLMAEESWGLIMIVLHVFMLNIWACIDNTFRFQEFHFQNRACNRQLILSGPAKTNVANVGYNCFVVWLVVYFTPGYFLISVNRDDNIRIFHCSNLVKTSIRLRRTEILNT